MLDAIELIEAHQPTEFSAYEADVVMRYFLLKQVEIIGEAAFKIEKDFKEARPSIPWRKIEGTRHILVHDYFDVDWSILWQILTEHMPSLKGELAQLVHSDDEG